MLLYLGCQWKMLPIDKGPDGRPEIHYTRVYASYRRWLTLGCFDSIFTGSVSLLHQGGMLDLAVIHGDGTTTAAKKGGDNIGFSGHKKMKGDKIVAFCDRNCNVLAPFVTAAGKQNESPLFREALPRLTSLAKALGLDLHGSVISLDGAYDCRANRKAIFNRGMVSNINENPRCRKTMKRGRKWMFNSLICVVNRIGRGYSFEALRAKILFTEGFQKVRNPHYQRQLISEGAMGKMPYYDVAENSPSTNYGVDISTLIYEIEAGHL
ncbi:transposase tnpA [Photorhabdus temperata subsp. temperata M1021]|nr:transposase tnpA [Photorhabdus temperata subsp. temperata M1021]